MEFPLTEPVDLPETGPVELAMDVHGPTLQFSWRAGSDEPWQTVGPALDASVISDEGGRGEHASFTGAFIAMSAFDTSGGGCKATYGRFDYIPLPFPA